ncbi:hypothetical protein D3C72_2308340 [compost metagenome]
MWYFRLLLLMETMLAPASAFALDLDSLRCCTSERICFDLLPPLRKSLGLSVRPFVACQMFNPFSRASRWAATNFSVCATFGG